MVDVGVAFGIVFLAEIGDKTRLVALTTAGRPDLVVEVASPSDRSGHLAERAEMWLGFGVRLLSAVHPDSRTVEVHSADAQRAGVPQAETFTLDDELDGGSVLPGFTYPLQRLFAVR